MARIDDEEIRAIECLDKLRVLLDRFGRRVGTPCFVARGKDEGGHHLRVTLLPVSAATSPAIPSVPNREPPDLSGLIAEFQMLSNVVGAQHRQILELLDVLASMEDGEPRPSDDKSAFTAALEEIRAKTKRPRLRIVSSEISETGD